MCSDDAKSTEVEQSLPIYSIASELVIGDPENPVYREVCVDKEWDDTCQYVDGEGTSQSQNSERIKQLDENPTHVYAYPDSPWIIHDDLQGLEAQRLGLWSLAKKEKDPSEVTGPSAIGTKYSSRWRRLIRYHKKNKKHVLKKDLADCDLDEEALKQKYLTELRKRKRFPYFLTYKIPFLRAFRPKHEPENKYSPMEIPDEVFERHFRGVKNPWDYPSSPLWRWTPPKI